MYNNSSNKQAWRDAFAAEPEKVLVELRFGRNVNGVPMADDRWADFMAEAGQEVSECLGAAIDWMERHTGVGVWTEDDGTVESEESAVVTAYCHPFQMAGAPGVERVGALVLAARRLAADYEQKAVAVVFQGRGHLARAAG